MLLRWRKVDALRYLHLVLVGSKYVGSELVRHQAIVHMGSALTCYFVSLVVLAGDHCTEGALGCEVDVRGQGSPSSILQLAETYVSPQSSALP